jgi:hypothetical protein
MASTSTPPLGPRIVTPTFCRLTPQKHGKKRRQYIYNKTTPLCMKSQRTNSRIRANHDLLNAAPPPSEMLRGRLRLQPKLNCFESKISNNAICSDYIWRFFKIFGSKCSFLFIRELYLSLLMRSDGDGRVGNAAAILAARRRCRAGLTGRVCGEKWTAEMGPPVKLEISGSVV